MEPVFVEGIVDEYTQSVTESLYRPVQRQVMDKEVAEVIRQMLVGVVEEGLGEKPRPGPAVRGARREQRRRAAIRRTEKKLWTRGSWVFTLRKNLDIPSPFCWTAAHTTATTLRRCSPK